MYANVINVFIAITSGWWDYGDDNYFLFAGANFLQVAQVVFNTKYFKSKRRRHVQGTGENGVRSAAR